MDALQALRTRRSIRKYLDKPVPRDILDQVLKAAMYAPSACNQQPWQFVVLEDRKLLREVPKIHPYATMAAEAPMVPRGCPHKVPQPQTIFVVPKETARSPFRVPSGPPILQEAWPLRFPPSQLGDQAQGYTLPTALDVSRLPQGV
jgi:nitroreductase